MKRTLVTAVIVISAVSQAAAGGKLTGVYLCEGERATGFRFEVGRGWLPTEFKPENFVLKLDLLSKGGDISGPIDMGHEDYSVTVSVANGGGSMKCEDEVHSGDADQPQGSVRYLNGLTGFSCRAYPSLYRFDFEAKRYLRFLYNGFTDGMDRPEASTPALEIGHCNRA
jgi:hypothetical protein